MKIHAKPPQKTQALVVFPPLLTPKAVPRPGRPAPGGSPAGGWRAEVVAPHGASGCGGRRADDIRPYRDGSCLHPSLRTAEPPHTAERRMRGF